MDKISKNIQSTPQVFVGIISIVLIISAIVYYFYINGLRSRECAFMNNIYGTLNTRIKPINASSKQCGSKLKDYYIKTAYNCCSGGSYKNDYVSSSCCVLKNILKQKSNVTSKRKILKKIQCVSRHALAPKAALIPSFL